MPSSTLPQARYPRRLVAPLAVGGVFDLRALPRTELVVPLTARQEGIWFFEQLSPGTSVHHLSEGYRICGGLDVQALHRAFDALAMRHEILRATFAYADERPMQIVAKTGTVPLEGSDLGPAPPEDREYEAARRCSAFAQRPFDLVKGPLARALLIKLSNDEHILQVTVHGIVADEASFAILWNDLGSSYRDALSGIQCSAAPAIQYGDFAAWHRLFIDGPALDRQRAYWSETLKNGIPALHLPFDHQRPVAAFASDRVETSIERDCMDAIARIADEGSCSTFVALMTAYVTFLHRYSGDRTIAVAFPVPGRTFPETEALIGPFANTVLLATEVDARASFTEFMQTVAARESGAYDNQDVPIEHVLRTLRSAGRASHIQTRLTAYESHRVHLALPGATTACYAAFAGTTSRTDLSFEIRDGEALTIAAEYDTALFERPTVERMLANFTTLLRGIADDPERPLGALPLLAEAERRLVVVDWNATEAPRTGPQLLHRLVEGQVRVRGAALAVVDAEGGIAYDELDRRANRLARMLCVLGVGRESLVGVCLDRSINAIVALLAVAKAGGAFVPLDPSYPDDRLAVMLADAAPRVLITTRYLAARLVTPTSTTVTTIEELFADSASQPNGLLPDIVEPDDAAYVIYTSGSTGAPKGVIVSHRSVCNMLLSARTDFGFEERDRVLQLAPLSFDPSVWQIFGTLAVGGCIVVPTSVNDHDVMSIAGDVVTHRVTVLIAVPALLGLLLELPELRTATSLRVVISGGTTLMPALRDRCAERLGVPLHNVYGPTETTIHVTQYRCDLGDKRDVIPIGRPIENVRAYILNEERMPVPIGVSGELYIGGAGVARGYLHRPELTAERFVPDPFSQVPGQCLYRTGDLARYLPDGNIAFLGRDDEQVEVCGVRVELGEVEAALEHHPSIARAVVVLHTREGDERLVAFVVPREPSAYDAGELRAHARAVLPSAAQPSAFVAVDALPTLPSGKVNRASLEVPAFAPVAEAAPAIGPVDTLHCFLVDLWEEVLGVRNVRITDDFFALGGHSLLAARLIARIETAFGKRLPFSTLFADPTIVGLACAIRSKERATFEPIVAVQTGGDRAPFFFVDGDFMGVGLYARRFAGALGPGQPIYVLPPHGADGGSVPATVEEMAQENLTLMWSVQPRGPYVLGGYCFGGVVALEMARQLRKRGEHVAHLIMIEGQGIRPRFAYVDDVVAAIACRAGVPDEISRCWLASRREDVRRVLERIFGRTAVRSSPPAIENGLPPAEFDPATAHVEQARNRALRAYVWRRVPVRATMLCAREQPDAIPATVRRDWVSLFDHLDVRLIPGNHMTSLTRNLPHLAAELSEILRCNAVAG